MGGGAWPFLVGGAICLVNSDNERDSSLLNRRPIPGCRRLPILLPFFRPSIGSFIALVSFSSFSAFVVFHGFAHVRYLMHPLSSSFAGRVGVCVCFWRRVSLSWGYGRFALARGSSCVCRVLFGTAGGCLLRGLAVRRCLCRSIAS